MNIKEIQAKIRKLQILADSAAKIGSLAEAEAATLKISKLLEKYNLSLFDLADSANKNSSDINIDFFGDIPARSPYGETWRQYLLATLCKFNYCRTIITTGKRMRIVGAQVNALVVIDLFNSLQSVYRYAAKQTGIKKTEISSFLLGCVAGLNSRLEQETQTTVMHTTKLVRHYEVAIDAFLARYFISNKKVRRSRRVAGEAFGEGFATGRNTPTQRTVQQQKLWE
jgi:hypothetical protein